MFRYYYRIFGKLQRPVTAVAIFTWPVGRKISDCYAHRFMGTELTYKYNLVKLGTHREQDLIANSNPFATVALIANHGLPS
jgi:hypothetical protein